MVHFLAPEKAKKNQFKAPENSKKFLSYFRSLKQPKRRYFRRRKTPININVRHLISPKRFSNVSGALKCQKGAFFGAENRQKVREILYPVFCFFSFSLSSSFSLFIFSLRSSSDFDLLVLSLLSSFPSYIISLHFSFNLDLLTSFPLFSFPLFSPFLSASTCNIITCSPRPLLSSHSFQFCSKWSC